MIPFKKSLLSSIALLGFFSSSVMGAGTTTYIPIALDDINILIPYNKPYVYTPPADSLAHTTITTTEGKKMRVDRTPNGLVFEGHENQIVLLEVYGYTCPHCIASIPGYNRLQAKYPKDVFVITVENYGLSDAGLKQFVIDNNLHYATVSKEKGGDIITYISILTNWSPGVGVPWLTVLGRDGKMVGSPMLGDIKETTVDNIIKGQL